MKNLSHPILIIIYVILAYVFIVRIVNSNQELCEFEVDGTTYVITASSSNRVHVSEKLYSIMYSEYNSLETYFLPLYETSFEKDSITGNYYFEENFIPDEEITNYIIENFTNSTLLIKKHLIEEEKEYQKLKDNLRCN